MVHSPMVTPTSSTSWLFFCKGDTLAAYMFIIYLHYGLRTSIDLIFKKWFHIKKTRKKRNPVETMTEADYADDLELYADTVIQFEYLRHSLKQAAGGVGLYVSANKTMYFKQEYVFFWGGKSLKLMDQLTHLFSNNSSDGSDVNRRIAQAGTIIVSLSIIWKSDYWWNLAGFLLSCSFVVLLYGCTTRTQTKHMKKNLDGNYRRMLRVVFEQILEAVSGKTSTVRPLTSHLRNHPS